MPFWMSEFFLITPEMCITLFTFFGESSFGQLLVYFWQLGDRFAIRRSLIID